MLKNQLKKIVENFFGLKIYRNSRPHGADLCYDLKSHAPSVRIKTVFDVGANVGDTAIYFSESFPQASVFAYEPVPETFRQLQSRTKQNARIHPFELALGNRVGELEIFVGEHSTANSLVVDRGGVKRQIGCSTVDEQVRQLNITEVGLLKIDVEGFEAEVLDGAKSTLDGKCRFVLVECEPMETEFHFIPLSNLDSILQKYGYKLWGIYDQILFPNGKSKGIYFNALYSDIQL